MRGVIWGVMVAVVAMGAAAPVQAQVPAGAARAAYTIEPFAPGGQITIQGAGVRLRAEPIVAADIPVLSSGSTGLPLNVVGIARLPDWNWYQVVLKSGQKAFIRSDYTSAPSKGGAVQPPTLPAPTRIDYGPAPASGLQSTSPVSPTPTMPTGSQAPISLRPAPAAPAPAAPAPSTPAYTAPTYTAPAYSAPVSVPTQPATLAPVLVQPPAPAAIPAPQTSDSAISLRPVSSMPAPATSSPAFSGPAPLPPPAQTPGDLVPSMSRSSNSAGLASN